MNIDNYQTMAHSFAMHNNPMYPALGLAEEAGEVLGKIAKFIRKHDGYNPLPCGKFFGDEHPSEWNSDNSDFLKDLQKELGDVMWMVAEICSVYGFALEEILENNIAKLEDRKNRNVIVGEGDNR